MNPEEHPLHRIQIVGDQLSDRPLAEADESLKLSLLMFQEVTEGSSDPQSHDTRQLMEMAIQAVDEARSAVNGIKTTIGQYLDKVNAPSSGSTTTYASRPTAQTEIRTLEPKAEQPSEPSSQPSPPEGKSDNETKEGVAEQLPLTHGITQEMIEAIERGEWPEIPYDQIRSTKLETGRIITGINTMAGFKAVERAIVAQLSPYSRAIANQDIILANESSIISKPIDDGLRKFTGRVKGQVIILPFSKERAQELGLARSYEEAADKNAGFRIVYTGELSSTGTGKIGAFTQEALYLQKRAMSSQSLEDLQKIALESGHASAKGGEVLRLLGKPQGLEKAALVRAGAVMHARRLAGYAMACATSGGTVASNAKKGKSTY